MTDRTCSVEGCERPVRVKSRGWCNTHYLRWKRSGDVGPAETKKASRDSDECAVDGCDRPYYARGWCSVHYERWLTTGDAGPAGIRIRGREGCDAPDCNRPHRSSGFCGMHYQRWQKTGNADDPVAVERQCNVVDCDRPHAASGYCGMHYQRWAKYGDPEQVGRAGWLGDDARYGTMHQRVWSVRGSAKSYRCAHCEGEAFHWAYDHEDPDERFDEDKGCVYSLRVEHYIPLCARCHKRFDMAHAASVS